MKRVALNEYLDKDGNEHFLTSASFINIEYFTDNPILHSIVKYHHGQIKKEVPKIGIGVYLALKLIFENCIKHENGIALTLSNGYYRKLPKRYNPNKITAYSLRIAIKYLEINDLVLFYKGFKDKKISFYSRLIPTRLLINSLKDTGLTPLDIEYDRKMERIQLKKSKEEGKRLADYEDSKTTNKERQFVLDYESFINSFNFTSENKKIGYIHFKRVFNNMSFKSGGRFYSSYQNIKSDIRSTKTKCNGISMTEFDYSGLHINMLYAMEGLPLYDGDVYTVEGYEEYRNLFKIALQIAINAKTRLQAIRGMNSHLRKKLKGEKLIKGVELLDLFAEKHHLIKKYFFSGVGLKLQFKDSKMVKIVLQEAMKLNIPVLPVHDSFLIRNIEQEKRLIVRLMNKASKKVLNVHFEIDQK